MNNIHESSVVDGQIDGVNPQLVTIGKYCVVGSRSALLTHCPIRGAKPVVLSNYVWIGYGVLILPGVTIGECCVVGAGSVVTKDVPGGSVVAGNPARVLRLLTNEEKRLLVHNLKNGLPMGKS
ncbi:hypothetical protein LCGC14_1117250 [marine sediment metagenome]|uniref:Maltose/galactoside acetyltransferase domain-containing protein n=1 Tax=marine sediment metagenome TaxID=412755 RepID=A0A0F9PN42_9ZZZZ